MTLENSGYIIYLVALAGVLHACLQLPFATLLHMAAHTLGRGQAKQALWLGISFSLGVFLTVIGLMLIYIVAMLLLPTELRFLLAGIVTTISGVIIMFAYFQGPSGARLWLSRRYIRWFHKYIEQRHTAVSAFSLGNLAILLELGFSLGLLLSAAALLSSSSADLIWRSFSFYGLIAAAPLLFATISLSGGSNILHMKKWRDEGKRFWQFFLGLGFILFGLYIASNPIVETGVLL